MYRKDFIIVFLIITGVSGLFAFQVFIVGFNASEQKKGLYLTSSKRSANPCQRRDESTEASLSLALKKEGRQKNKKNQERKRLKARKGHRRASLYLCVKRTLRVVCTCKYPLT